MAGSRIRIVISSGARSFMHEGLKALINTTLSIFGYQIQRIHPDNPNPVHLWDEKYFFNDLMKQIEQHTLVDKVRCFMIYQLAKQASMLQGDVAEVGVYKGGTARLLAKAVETREKHCIYLIHFLECLPQISRRISTRKEIFTIRQSGW